MKNILFTIMLFSGLNILSAQNVGIGTTSPQKVLHIDAAKNNSAAAPAPPARDTRNDDDVTVSNTGNVSVGNISPATRLDIRSANIQNPQDAIGIGNTTQAANAAGAGALKYYSVTPSSPDFANGKIGYSDGSSWLELQARVPNDFVQASNASGQALPSGTTTQITNWTETEDVNNSFNPATGTFTAIKSGAYLVTFTYTIAASNLGSDTRMEALINTNSASPQTNTVFKCVNSFPGANANVQATGQCSGIFNLTKGDNITVSALNGFGANKNLDSDASYTTLSIFGI